MKKYTLTAIALAVACASQAHAAGYQLNEYSITGLGRSFAGAGVVGDDYSALAYNPAGMTLMKRSGFQGSLTVAEMMSDVKSNTTGDSTDMHYGVPLPSGFAHWNVNDKLFLGAGIYVPYGLSTKHDQEGFVAGSARKSELEVIDSSVAGAYKVTDKLSLGATLTLRYIHGHMTGDKYGDVGYGYGKLGDANYDLDGWTGAGTIGAMYEFTPNTRVGISYKFRSIQKVKGDFTFNGQGVYSSVLSDVASDGLSSPDLPAGILVSGYHKLNDKIGLSSSVRWTEWNKSFSSFTMESSFAGSSVTQQYDWRNTWTVSAGADYYYNDNWTFRVGTAYDQSPAKSQFNRTNRIPDTNRIWLSAGLSYVSDNWQIDAGYAHLFMQKGNVAMEGNTPAEYTSSANMYGINFQYKF
ncbi:MAG: outer membrane protein transport protein [Alphaproteobacteria bacterium]|nr:outer membrane protein transport protein [Alphaproteobacteria bacterium]